MCFNSSFSIFLSFRRFIFTKKFVTAKSMIEKLKNIAKAFGFVKYDLRPQQTKLLNEDDVGSWLNMPYFNGEETDRYALYDGKALSLKHFIEWVGKFSVNSLDDIKLDFIKKENKSNEILPGGPPCLQDLLSQGALAEGGRNNGLFNIGVYLRKRYPEDWQEKLEEYNDEYIDPPLKPREFTTVLNSLDKKSYNYKCKDSPINSVCNKTKCLTCEYGISDDGTMPVLNSITKILTNPPQYFLTLNESKIGPLSSKQIYNFIDFKQVVFENLDMLLPKINDKLWTESVNDLMSRVIAVEAPKDSSNEGRLLDLLERFCTGSTSSSEVEDILRGKAIVSKTHTEFRINDLMEFLDRHRFKEFKLNEITLTFTDDAIESIANVAFDKELGARGLRGIIEKLLIEHQYNINRYTKDGVTEIVIDKDTVLDNKEAKLIYSNERS